ncbi:MAG: Quinone oxidoreductase [Pseudonocardiales bacterium]|nr:Quinone oxidoreductase [Pseudonocardiales bacterium]
MTSSSRTFPALLVDHSGESSRREVVELSLEDLEAGEVTIEVEWSGLNYKDALAASKDGKVARISPLIPGIDLAGTVIASTSPEVRAGDVVLVHGYDLGVAHHGGFARIARVPAAWVVPLPAGLSAHDAMTIGTAGFTAALSVDALEVRGLRPGGGPILVTGATGGVGSIAVDILATRGYEVVASTGKPDAAQWLRDLGAVDVIGREEAADASRPLQRERWAGAVDCVGGSTLPYILSSLRYGAAVAASGNTGGMGVQTTVLPFILRGVALLGIDSVQCAIDRRREVWARIATDLRPRGLEALGSATVSLAEIPQALDALLQGAAQGRTLVELSR